MEKMVRVILRDKVIHHNHYLALTREQHRLLIWLANENMIDNVEIEEYEEYSFEQI